MFGKILLLTTLTLAQSRPDLNLQVRLWKPSDLCPAIHQHYLLPHEYDCTKYYYCEYGMKYIEARNCAPGTEFSAEIQVCVHPNLANCNLPGLPATTDASETPTIPSNITTPASNTTTHAPTTPSNITTPTPNTTTPAPTTPSNMTTPAQNTTTPAPTTPSNITTPAPTTTSNITTPTPNTTTPAPTTPSNMTTPAQNTTTPAPTTPSNMTTPAQNTTTPTPTTPSNIMTPAPNTTTPAPTSPSNITTPAPTTPSNITTPSPNITTPAPTIPSNITTPAPNTTTPVPTTPVNIENKCKDNCNIAPWAHSDCDKFWQCEADKAVLITCSEGLHFNPESKTCDFICNTGCIREELQSTTYADGIRTFAPFTKINGRINGFVEEIIETTRIR